MANTRDRRSADESGCSRSSSTTDLTPGKRTLVESQHGGSAEVGRGYAPEALAGQAEPQQQRTEGALRTQATQINAVFGKGRRRRKRAWVDTGRSRIPRQLSSALVRPDRRPCMQAAVTAARLGWRSSTGQSSMMGPTGEPT